ncbi:hypothetical protein KFK09_028402 [Dendrobium nobile]|uniref:Uncharacterized protein n=1 Tax=Dendrobium nobile TaxID=94219 RepID=A0A8T3A1H0_DENNO|nr:hypothetical protein KFK09_028402 [Dendrobium nobile]
MHDEFAAVFTIKIRKIHYNFVTQNKVDICRFQQSRGIKFPSVFLYIYSFLPTFVFHFFFLFVKF